MGTTLSNGVYLPDEGERNCYAGLKVNWEILNQKVADISALQLAIAGALHRQIVASLPTEDIDPNTIYMILSGTSATENVYNEFMYVNNAWELIGTSATDLTNYYTKAEVDGKLLLKANASDLTSHTGDTTIHVTANDKTKWNNSANTHVLRLALSALTPSTSNNSFSNLDDSTALKVGDKVMDTAGVLFEVTAIDTQNSTFTIGTALIDLAQDSDVVHKSGNETLGGIKTFSNDIRINKISPFCNMFSSGYIKGQAPTSNMYSGVRFFDDINSGSPNNITGGFEIEYNRDGYNKSYIVSRNYAGETHKFFNIGLRVPNDDIRSIDFLPSVDGIVNLGTSTNKWKTFNGLEPSSLSLPSGNLNDVIDISSYLVNLDGTLNTYTAPANGWIAITMSNSSGIQAYITGLWGHQIVRPTAGGIRFLMPILKNNTANIIIFGGTIDNARFIPCQGNV